MYLRPTLAAIFVWISLICRLDGQQCEFDLSVSIPDTQTTTVTIEVEGLANGDLSGSQGVCAVDLTFRHDYVGDLTITLISPSGQSVQLVGDVTDAINPTNLSSWDIRFLPCGFPASPDPGFNTTWSNEQAWQVFTNYTGSYHPFAGCLEDFDTGSANGIWELVVTDNDLFQTGEIVSVQFTFCDNTGLDCTLCASDAGGFAEVNLEICEGESLPSGAFEPEYADQPPDPASFGYHYLFGDGSALTFEDQINANILSAGNYTVCGLSYSRQDSSDLFGMLDTMSIEDIRQAFLQGDVPYCASLTETCVALDVLNQPDTFSIDTTICPGETIEVGNQVISNSGLHMVNLPVTGSCDSVVIVDLAVTSLQAVIVQTDTLSCNNQQTTLDGSASVAGPGAQYAWTTTTGSIVGDTDQIVITIGSPGHYTLEVRDGMCSTTAEWDAVADGSFPDIIVTDGVIDCNNPVFMFEPVIFPPNLSVNWTGPGGFTADTLNPTVTSGGTYYLQVTDITGCSYTESVEVVMDTVRPELAFLEIKDCEDQSTFLSLLPADNTLYEYQWEGPGNFSAAENTISVDVAGEYQGTITANNGCSSTGQIDIDTDYTVPEVMLNVLDDTVNCSDSIIIEVINPEPGSVYQWNGPSGITSDSSAILADRPGQYTLVTTNQNACSSNDTLNLEGGGDLFEIFPFHDTLTCIRDTAFIGVLTDSEIVSYQWSGPAPVDSAPFVKTTVAGAYRVTLEDTSGCVQIATINAGSDTVPVPYTLIGDTITCEQDTGTLTINTGADLQNVEWVFNQQVVGTSITYSSPEPGLYQVIAIGENGCESIRYVELAADTMPPEVILTGGTIGCDGPVSIGVLSVDSIISYDWIGPGGQSFTGQTIQASVEGTYLLEALGVNGCYLRDSISVTSDLSVPQFTLDSVIVDCDMQQADLSVSLSDPLATVVWTLPGGSTDTSGSLLADIAGIYLVEVFGANGCSGRDSVEIPGFERPELTVQADTLTCLQEVVTLMASSDLPDVQFFWSDSAGVLSVTDSLQTAIPGQYQVIAMIENGCATDTMIEVSIDTVSPVPLISREQVPICSSDQEVMLTAGGSIGEQLTFLWSTPNGQLLSSPDVPEVSVSGSGFYILDLTDGSNGCMASDTLMLAPDSELGEMELQVIPECRGNADGQVTILNVTGANSMLEFFVDGVSYGSQKMLDGLSAGSYSIEVVDVYGCRIDTTVILTDTDRETSVDLGPDQEVAIGTTVELTTQGPDTVSYPVVMWTPEVSCNSCLTNIVTPLETTTYRLVVSDEFGCSASDEVTIFVEERAQVYIANVFSPNGDGINDEITLHLHPGILFVNGFTVYDRWGNAVYSRRNFPPDDASVRWDGRHEGRLMNPAVFAWVLDVELISGRRQILSGDLTLIR